MHVKVYLQIYVHWVEIYKKISKINEFHTYLIALFDPQRTEFLDMRYQKQKTPPQLT